jgi:hypothetical protein
MKALIGNLINRMLGQGPAVLWAMVAGGILWIVHGYFRFMTPQGPDAVWREDLQYSPILSTELFLLYNLPGALALLLTAWAALSYLPTLRTARTGLRRAAQMLVLLASIFGLIATAGQVVLFVPMTTGGISLGVPVLGLALFLTGLAVIRDAQGPYGHPGLLGPALMLLGVTGMFTLPLQPLMYALALLPLAFGTGLFALFGIVWIILGFSTRNETVKEAGASYA